MVLINPSLLAKYYTLLINFLNYASPPRSPHSEATCSPLSFVMIAHPSDGTDEEVRQQVRSHAANNWRGVSRLRTSRRVCPRTLEPKAYGQNANRQFKALESLQTSSQAEDDDTQPDRSTNTSSFASSSVAFKHRSAPQALLPKSVTYLRGGIIDPFDRCSLRCHTVEPFVLNHSKCRPFGIRVDLSEEGNKL